MLQDLPESVEAAAVGALHLFRNFSELAFVCVPHSVINVAHVAMQRDRSQGITCLRL